MHRVGPPLLVVLLVALAAQPARAARPTCFPPKSRTVAETRLVRVFTTRKKDEYSETFACLKRTPKRIALDDPNDEDFDFASHVRIAGTWVGWIDENPDYNTDSASAGAMNLRTRRSHGDDLVPSTWSTGYGIGGFVLSPTGTIAWMATDFTIMRQTDAVAQVRVQRPGELRSRVLDAGYDLRDGTLALSASGKTLTWRRADAIRTVSLVRPPARCASPSGYDVAAWGPDAELLVRGPGGRGASPPLGCVFADGVPTRLESPDGLRPVAPFAVDGHFAALGTFGGTAEKPVSAAEVWDLAAKKRVTSVPAGDGREVELLDVREDGIVAVLTATPGAVGEGTERPYAVLSARPGEAPATLATFSASSVDQFGIAGGRVRWFDGKARSVPLPDGAG